MQRLNDDMKCETIANEIIYSIYDMYTDRYQFLLQSVEDLYQDYNCSVFKVLLPILSQPVLSINQEDMSDSELQQPVHIEIVDYTETAVSYKQLLMLANALNVHISTLHYDEDNLSIVFFNAGFIYTLIPDTDFYLSNSNNQYSYTADNPRSELQYLTNKLGIAGNQSRILNYVKQHNYASLFDHFRRGERANVLSSIFASIPDKYKLKTFIDVYTDSECKLSEFDEDILDYLETNKAKYRNRYKGLPSKHISNAGTLTIYRGTYTEAPFEYAYSWSLEPSIALNFACRKSIFRGGEFTSCILEANVNIDDILFFSNGRKELEVVVLPQHIINVCHYIEFIQIKEVKKLLRNSQQSVINLPFNRSLFDSPDSIHGINHTKRVLALCIVLANLNKLSKAQTGLLIAAAKYHDIGRTHDGKCLKHGYLSFKKVIKQQLVTDLSNDRIEILRFIIENHCIDDSRAYLNLKRYNIKDINMALELFNIFKDADALDRVRINDLDISYLRNIHSCKLAVFAKYQYYNPHCLDD